VTAPLMGDTLLLSFDFEDWHQLVHRRLGLPDWDKVNPAFPRQVRTALDLLDEIGATATFFLLGMTAKNYPELVEELVARGHEPACHGFAHRRVFEQTADDFRADVEQSVDVIDRIAGQRPLGYRAPAFSLNRDAVWAYGILADLGFRWDSSQYDSPRIPRRLRSIPTSPYVLREPGGCLLWEFPIAVSDVLGRSLPVGGGSYWRLLPARTVAFALRRRSDEAGAALYVHPYELDPLPLRPELPANAPLRQRANAMARRFRVNPGRARVPTCLRYLAREFRLVSYREAFEALSSRDGNRTRTLSPEGILL